VGAAQEVHKTLGRGMHERIYQEALAVELKQLGMDFEREKHLHVTYKGVDLQMTYIADFYYKGIIVELKSLDTINSDNRAQLFNYMRITDHERGILLNFGEKSLRAERYLYLPDDDNFILLTRENYKRYIKD
jgi:GxxExxY protein